MMNAPWVCEEHDEITALSATGVMPDEQLFPNDIVDGLGIGFLGVNRAIRVTG